MIKIIFECDLGYIPAEYETMEQVEKAFQWFVNQYRWHNPHIKEVKEIIAHGSTKSKL